MAKWRRHRCFGTAFRSAKAESYECSPATTQAVDAALPSEQHTGAPSCLNRELATVEPTTTPSLESNAAQRSNKTLACIQATTPKRLAPVLAPVAPARIAPMPVLPVEGAATSRYAERLAPVLFPDARQVPRLSPRSRVAPMPQAVLPVEDGAASRHRSRVSAPVLACPRPPLAAANRRAPHVRPPPWGPPVATVQAGREGRLGGGWANIQGQRIEHQQHEQHQGPVMYWRTRETQASPARPSPAHPSPARPTSPARPSASPARPSPPRPRDRGW